jgi:hypothetical protein
MRFTTEEATSVPSPALKPTREVEDRPLGDRGDPAAHLRVHDDPDDADDDDPEELKAEGRSGLGVEHQVADVDETADRGEDPERDLQELLHELFAAIVARSCCRVRCSASFEPEWESRSRSSRRRTARAASRRASGVLPAESVATDVRALARR